MEEVLWGWGSLWGWVYGDPTSPTTPQIVSPIGDECHGGGAMGLGGGGFMGLGVPIGLGVLMGLGVSMGFDLQGPHIPHHPTDSEPHRG